MRKPLVLVEIVQDFCSLTYGSSPCTASVPSTGTTKCFNTKKTCQDQDNYTKSSLSLFFGKSNAENPKDLNIIPSVTNISFTPTLLNPANSSTNSSPLGQRSMVTVSFQDHIHSDLLVDKYRSDRDYNPLESGTFWAKWKSRNPYYKNRVLRVYEGFVGDSINDMTKKEYFIDSVSGPSSTGSVSIVAKDILKLADDKTAQAPPITAGELIVDIGEGDSVTTLRITNAVVADYAFFNTVRIGKELFTFTGTSTISSTEINLTGVTRSTDDTIAEDHKAGDRVQACLRYTSERVDNICKDLLLNYGNIDSSYIDSTEWNTEGSTWLNNFTVSAVITEPLGVTKLIGELTEQFLFYIWWNEKDQKIKMEAIKPVPDGEVNLLSDDYSIIENSVSLKDDNNNRFSQIWVFYSQKLVTEKIDEESNYTKVSIRADLAAESDDEYQEQKIKKIYSRWVGTESQAQNITARMLSRFRETQKTIQFDVDAKESDLWTGGIVDIKHRNYVDFTGAEKIARWQIISAQDVETSHKKRIMLSLYEYGAGDRFGVWTVDAMTDYENSSEAERQTNSYWSNDEGLIPYDDSLGYNWI